MLKELIGFRLLQVNATYKCHCQVMLLVEVKCWVSWKIKEVLVTKICFCAVLWVTPCSSSDTGKGSHLCVEGVGVHSILWQVDDEAINNHHGAHRLTLLASSSLACTCDVIGPFFLSQWLVLFDTPWVTVCHEIFTGSNFATSPMIHEN